MITIFTAAKAFQGESAVILRNAVQDWKLFHPARELILFGDKGGGAEVCAELGLRHEPRMERHESGFKYVNYMFDRAQQIPRDRTKQAADFGDYFVFSKGLFDGVPPLVRPVCTRLGLSSEALRRSRREDSSGVDPLR